VRVVADAEGKLRSATVQIDAERASAARSLAALARASARDGGPLVCVAHRAYGDLADELGGDDAAVGHLLRVATNTGRPIAVNFPTEDGSRTLFVAPKHWTEERLRGWAAARHEALEAAFGPATPVRMEDP